MDRDTLRFIDRIYKDLYKSPEVLKHSSGNETEKFKNLEEYMNTLESVHERAAKSAERIKTIKRMYHNKYVIKRENIPDSYYELQERMALERGFGHVKISDNQKVRLQAEVIENQQTSLDRWIDYFISEDAKFYPFWAKYWAFQGMLKMGIYDKEKGTFSRRTKDTAAPFIDLNREALAESLDLVIKMIGKEPIDDRDLEIIVKSGSFSKIYTYVLTKILTNNENIIKRDQGIWVKYNQGSDHMPLVNSLKGYNTGWCTAGESTAESQLKCGDFYVYYTLDEKNEYKVPRIAIRMEGDRIGEIRGIASHQNVESNMEKVVEEKLKDFPDKDRYYRRVSDMKKLTELYNKYEKEEEFSIDELRFLYEIDGKIQGFGYEEDPRIMEIKFERDMKDDLSRIWNCDKSLIALKNEKYDANTVFYDGSIGYAKLFPDGIVLPKNMSGDLLLFDLESLEGLKLPEYIGGNLSIRHVMNVDNIIFPKYVGGYLDASSATSAKGAIFPARVEGTVTLDSLEDLKDMTLPTYVGESFLASEVKNADGTVFPRYVGDFIDVNSLISARNAIFPEVLAGSLKLDYLEDATGAVFPKYLSGYLDLSSLESLEGVTLPENIGKSLYLVGLENIKNVILSKKVGGTLHLENLKSAENVTFPENIGEQLRLDYLRIIKDSTFPKYVGHDVFLDKLEYGDGLILPEYVGINLSMNNLQSAKGTIFPKRVDGEVSLWDLKILENSILPEEIMYDLKLNHLKKIKNTALSKIVKGNVALGKLENADNVVFPEFVGKDLVLFDLWTAKGAIFPETIGGRLYAEELRSIEGAILPKNVGEIYAPIFDKQNKKSGITV